MTCIPGELASMTQPVVSNRDQGIPRGSDKKSEWSRLDAHNPEDTDEHTKTNMSLNILSSVGLPWILPREISSHERSACFYNLPESDVR